MPRTVHTVVLYGVLLTQAWFFALAPTVYAYVSSVGMSYGRAPVWFARTAPARATARLFEMYNDKTAAAYRRIRLTCYLRGAGTIAYGDCTHRIGAGQTVSGPPDLRLAPGWYKVTFEFSERDACANGRARLQVIAVGTISKVLTSYDTMIRPGQQIELQFPLTLVDAALDTIELRVFGLSDCVLLNRIGLTERILPSVSQ